MRVLNPMMSNSLYSKLLFRYNAYRLKRPYYSLNIKQPKTFNEKICYIKFNERNLLAPIVADKYAVRKYVEDKIGAEYLIPLIKTYDSPSEINITDFKEDVILKLNTGSGGNFLLTRDANVSNEEIRKYFEAYFKTDFYLLSREWHYKEIKPKLVVEELIGDNPNDYKFFCNQEGPFAIQVDSDRYIDHKRNLYDLEWNLLPQTLSHGNIAEDVPKPKFLNKMIELATILSKDFTFSRIDFYEVKDEIWFGEITMHPEGGAGPFDSYESDLKFGNFVSIQE